MKKKLRLIVLGIMGRTPVAGVAWQALHYVEAMRRLGHDVYYVEDTQTWPYNPETAEPDSAYTVNYIARLMSWCGLANHWAFCDVSQAGRVHGLSENQLSALLAKADAIINVTGSSELRESHLQVPVRVYLETDPGVPQLEMDQGKRYTIDFLNAHTHHFTFAENIGKPQCPLPTSGINYRPTRQPIVIDWWNGADNAKSAAVFTTISTWRQSNDIVWNGETYTWSKDRQFMRFIDLPEASGQPLELALACDDAEARDFLRRRGWRVVDAVPLTGDIFPYREYIAASRGEFTVAKDQYVRLRTAWFSDRSACYLAAGRPVITQDSGFGSVIPEGEGLFAFSTLDDALAALEKVNSDYEKHCRAARAIAEEYFRAETVVGNMLQEIGL